MVRSSLLAVLALVSAGGGPAHAEVAAAPVGRACGFNSMTDFTAEAGHQVGDVNGGPVVHTEPGTLTCSITVNANYHLAPGAARRSGTTGLVSVVAAPVSYRATAMDDVTVCSEYTSGAQTWYWSAGSRPGAGVWTTDPNVSCTWSGPWDLDLTCPVLLAADARLGTPLAATWQDCESYEPII